MGGASSTSRSGRFAGRRAATVDDLYHVPESGKAEIVDGKLIRMSPTGFLPSRASSNIYLSLRAYEGRTRSGYAIADNAAYVVNLPDRQSFSPDASFYVGPPTGGKFMTGAPVFAAEVRSEGDYGPVAEKKIAKKRAGYFAAGTKVVWDVDVLRKGQILAYGADRPDEPRVYRRGETAEAEPAVPGWTMAVADLYE